VISDILRIRSVLVVVSCLGTLTAVYIVPSFPPSFALNIPLQCTLWRTRPSNQYRFQASRRAHPAHYHPQVPNSRRLSRQTCHICIECESCLGRRTLCVRCGPNGLGLNETEEGYVPVELAFVFSPDIEETCHPKAHIIAVMHVGPHALAFTLGHLHLCSTSTKRLFQTYSDMQDYVSYPLTATLSSKHRVSYYMYDRMEASSTLPRSQGTLFTTKSLQNPLKGQAWKWFDEQFRLFVIAWYPDNLQFLVMELFSDKVAPDVDMFRSLVVLRVLLSCRSTGDCIVSCKSCTSYSYT
jgi:hypothetical protein